MDLERIVRNDSICFERSMAVARRRVRRLEDWVCRWEDSPLMRGDVERLRQRGRDLVGRGGGDVQGREAGLEMSVEFVGGLLGIPPRRRKWN